MYLSQINKISWGVTRQKQALLLTFLKLSDFQSIQTKDTKELIYIYIYIMKWLVNCLKCEIKQIK